MKGRKLKIILSRVGLPFLVFYFFVSGCDWALPTKLSPPTWNTTLTIPILDKSYPLADLAGGNDSMLQVSGDSMFVTFSDSLQTVTLTRDNFFVSTGAQPLGLSQSMPGFSFPPLQAGPDSLSLPIPSQIIIPDPLSAGDSIILKDAWNLMADTLSVNDSSSISVPASTTDQISEFFSAYSIVIDDSSNFVTSVTNDTPGIISEIQIALMVRNSDGSSYFLADHSTTNLPAGSSFNQNTDLSGKRLNSLNIVVITRISFAHADTNLIVTPGSKRKLSLTSSLDLRMSEIHGLMNTVPLIDTTSSMILPTTNETQIISGSLADAQPDTNRMEMGFTNNFPLGINLSLEFLNIQDSLGNPLTIDTLIPPSGSLDLTKNLSSMTLASLQAGEVMTEMSYKTRVSIPASTDTAIFPFDGTPMGDFGADIMIHDFQFASLSGIFNLQMPSPPTSISIPQGMTGIGIAEPQMTLTLDNEIGLPIGLDLTMTAKKQNTSLVMKVSPLLNYPQNGADNAETRIILNQDGMFVYWDDILDPAQTYAGSPSLADLINLGPDSFTVKPTASIRGEGNVEAGKKIRGSYSVLALFKILPDTQVFMPNEFTVIEPWDSSLADQILSTAVEGVLNSTVRDRFPLHGRLSMLLSDSTVFPENRKAENLALAGVDSISHDTLYFLDGSTSWVDTMFRIYLPKPDIDPLTGAAQAIVDTNVLSVMTYQTIEKLAENKIHYAIPKITLFGSDQMVWIRTSDFVSVSAYMGFTITSEGFLGGGSSDSLSGGGK